MTDGTSLCEEGHNLKDAHKTPRVHMPERGSRKRRKDWDEVPLGYTAEMAQKEAIRCLQCKKPLCVIGCPVGIDIPAFIKSIVEGDFVAAAKKIKETNSLPAVCGRVCPQEDQCEKMCILTKKFTSVAIGNLERFAADFEMEHGEVELPEIPPPTGYKVAVVGSGPAGLSAAGELVKMGHEVVIFEALHKPGGVLLYGIPEFRLPKDVVGAEINYLKRLGVKIEVDSVIGKVDTVEELLEEGFDAVFVAVGAGLPLFMGIPGENLCGVYSANEYLTRANLMKAFDPEYVTPLLKKRRIAVVGGGNVAMDAARTALRMNGTDEVYIVYRRSREEMPARIDEIKHGEEEGINFMLLTNPVRILGDENGWAKALECIKMELGEPDASGRRRPVPIEGSEFILDVDCVIMAIGTSPNPLISTTTLDMRVTPKGTIVVDDKTGQTTKEGVFAGGDIVTGAATVILAMGAGKHAARAIDQYVRTKQVSVKA
ncbi:MAG: NADPH-dependent glutamate synthase [Candidatus Brocadiales bacterium]